MNKIAQVPIGPQFDSPFGQGATLGTLVTLIISNAYVVASVILLFLLIFGGISIMMGAGQNNPEQAARGRKAATSAVIGYLIIFASYWIIQIVEKITGFSILRPLI